MNVGNETLPPARLHEEIALLAAYLLSSGRGLLEEPADYSSYRCADAARRALLLLEQAGGGSARLTAVRKSLDDLMFAPMGGDVDLASVLDALCADMASGLQELPC
ncbi:DUF6092 family protein [Streptomyces yaizuensis]|uniref:DUF6092 family protein n=1 Tax=Streptomyces yaizuensis TaxID=2989713 RepID=A0ABQ5PAK5_9ACTN|nr:DUF6092 family protein [Streptomyces sp. YSPA8]GLF99625.1 DUF6092 family protein [Streptomyces sp. YSPA8]